MVNKVSIKIIQLESWISLLLVRVSGLAFWFGVKIRHRREIETDDKLLLIYTNGLNYNIPGQRNSSSAEFLQRAGKNAT